MSKNSTLKTSISRENARVTQVTEEIGEGHRSKQVRVFRCDRETSEYFPQYASQSGEALLQDIQQLLEETNSDITASEATELEHKKTFEEWSDTKNEEIVANTQEAQETTLSNDRKNWKGPRSTSMSRRHFLRISTQLDISEIQTTADSIEISG